MAAPSALTLNYDAVLSTTLFNLGKMILDEISTTNALLFKLMKKDDGYESVDDIGDRAQIPLMYELAQADSYSGYDTLSVQPTDGITSAFFDWRQASVPVVISGLEEKKNQGEAKIVDLMTAKVKQSTLGIQDMFGRAMLQGQGVNDGTSITSARVSPLNNSLFVEPIPSLIRADPTTSTSIGNINQSTNVWWRNQFLDITTTSTYVGFLKNLRTLNNRCSKGPGGAPDFHVATQGTYELYEAALAAAHRNPSYQKSDIPFDNIAFKGGPLVWDEFVADAKNNTVTITKGTWYMFNLKYWGIKYHSGTNFVSTPFVKPYNQDAKVSHIMWLGLTYVNNRRKQGVLFGVDETIAA